MRTWREHIHSMRLEEAVRRERAHRLVGRPPGGPTGRAGRMRARRLLASAVVG